MIRIWFFEERAGIYSHIVKERLVSIESFKKTQVNLFYYKE